ncbi:MAG: DUF973 family protein [Thermoplasmata archaeon]
MIYCPNCDRPNPPDRTTCWGCSASLARTATVNPAPPASRLPSGVPPAGLPALGRPLSPAQPRAPTLPPSRPPPPASFRTAGETWNPPVARTTQNLPSDIPSQQAARGAFRIFVAVLLGLVAVVTVLVILPIEVSALASAPPTTVGTPAISQYFEVLEAITFVGIALGAAQLYLLATGFGMLAGGDEEFRTPATMIWVGFVGVIFVSVAVLTEFGGGFALLGLLAIVVGAIFAGVGGIGVLIGFWRMGVTYEVGRMKLAVILLCIPYVDALGYAFLLRGTYLVWKRLARESSPTNFF